MARSNPIIRVTVPSIRSTLFFFDGFQLSAASVSIETLLDIQRSTGYQGSARNAPRHSPFTQAAAIMVWSLRM